jgi:hypothetical protein
VQDQTETRLRRIRGSVPLKRPDARTIAALTSNPGCARRAVLDAARVDKEYLAQRVGFPSSFGQSPYAIIRGNVFEARVRADECIELLRLLREDLGIDLPGVSYADLGATDRVDDTRARHARSRSRLLRAISDARQTISDGGSEHAGSEHGDGGEASLFAHPLLRISVGGQQVYVEPDLVAVQRGGMIHVIEIKSFPVIDGQADGEKAAAAAIQAAVYVLALRRMLGRPELVSDEVVLVCPKDFSNTPVASKLDVRRQILVLEHQLARLTDIGLLLDTLPVELTFDGDDRCHGATPAGPVTELTDALGCLPARYVPGCLSVCDMAFFCRHEAAGRTAALGVEVREQLGGVETVAEALGLAEGTVAPADDQIEAAAMLRTIARVYASALDRPVQDPSEQGTREQGPPKQGPSAAGVAG